MALQVQKLNRPTVRLVGNLFSNRGLTPFNEYIDHTKLVLTEVGLNIVKSDTKLDKSDILSFYKEARIIITTWNEYPRMRYRTQGSDLSSLEFEGKVPARGNIVGDYAETFYTLNGKDPVRTKSYLYKYFDYNNYVVKRKWHEVTNPSAFHRPTNPSFNPSVIPPPGYWEVSDNITDLGFRIRRNIAGEDNMILKAKTYYQGNESNVTVVEFRIINPDIENIDSKM